MNLSPASELTVWVVDDDESIRWVLERALGGAGMQVTSFPGGAELLDALDEAVPDVLLTDIRMPGISGLDLLERVHAVVAGLPIIIVTAHSDLDSAVASFKSGAFEYLPKPFDLDEAVELVTRAARLSREADIQRPARQAAGTSLIGEARPCRRSFVPSGACRRPISRC